MNNHIDEIKVQYKVFKQDICERLDNQIEKLANEQGLSLSDSGFDFKTQTRDLHFASDIKLKEIK